MPKGDRLGEFELLVLLALMHLGDRAYGVSVRREIETRTGRSAAIGAIYTTLDRLAGKGFVKSALGEPTAARGGRAKRFFRIEASGRQAVEQSLGALEKMAAGLADGRSPA